MTAKRCSPVVGVGEEGFEDLLGGEADLASDGDGGEVFGIDLVGAELVGDAERVEQAGGVGFRWACWSSSVLVPASVDDLAVVAW